MKTSVNRRDFLRRIFAGPTGAVAGNLKAVAGTVVKSTVAQTRTLTIIDTHTHFYDPTRAGGVPWPPKDDPLLYRRVLPEHYKALPKPSPVTGTVVVEASPLIEDNEWILELAAHDLFIVGFVGNLPVGTADFMRHLNNFSHNSIFRGVRLTEDQRVSVGCTRMFSRKHSGRCCRRGRSQHRSQDRASAGQFLSCCVARSLHRR